MAKQANWNVASMYEVQLTRAVLPVFCRCPERKLGWMYVSVCGAALCFAIPFGHSFICTDANETGCHTFQTASASILNANPGLEFRWNKLDLASDRHPKPKSVSYPPGGDGSSVDQCASLQSPSQRSKAGLMDGWDCGQIRHVDVPTARLKRWYPACTVSSCPF